MIPVRCHTNLDLDPYESWPTELPAVPSVGDEIASASGYGGFHLSLQVVKVRWEPDFNGNYRPCLELHMTESQKRLPSKTPGYEAGSIVAFYEWYAPLVGRSVSSFI